METRSAAESLAQSPLEETILDADQVTALIGGALDIYCEELLRITTKRGGMAIPFVFNRAQRYVDARLDAQLERDHQVRALILKGRQQGISTYVSARFFRRVHAVAGTKAYILTHEEKATENLFNIPKRFYANLPTIFRPRLTRQNAVSLIFGDQGSAYGVGTAGAKATGRSTTNHVFHGSEVAYWPNAEDHLPGVLETVPMGNGSEVILESTGNGVGNLYHSKWLDAEANRGEFIAIFVPWFWQDEYRRTPPDNWQPEEEEAEVIEAYGLDRDQGYWMHLKNITLGGKQGQIGWKFKQEYPCNAEEAFQSGGAQGLIKGQHVVRARRLKLEVIETEPKLLGVDVARNAGGDEDTGDATELISRQGRVVGRAENMTIHSDDLVVVADAIHESHRREKYDMIFIDITGVGAGVYDILRARGLGSCLTPVNFGSQSLYPKRFMNKRAEMWWALAEYFAQEGGVDMPDEDVFHRHLCSATWKTNESGRIKLEPKEAIRKRLKISPDKGDALATTFAVRIEKRKHGVKSYRRNLRRSSQARGYMAA